MGLKPIDTSHDFVFNIMNYLVILESEIRIMGISMIKVGQSMQSRETHLVFYLLMVEI